MGDEKPETTGEEAPAAAGETEDNVLSSIFDKYESDVKGKMLSKYFSKALAEAGVDLPEVEVRDLTFLADPKSCGWIKKEDFLRVTNVARDQQADADKLVALIQSHYGEGSVNLEDLGGLLREAGGLGAGSEEEGEWRRVMEAAAGADGKADAGDLVSALLHPEGKCSESPLDSISINLAQ